MTVKAYRIEKDTMGEVKVPRDALYGAQTQRAVENFPVSGRPMPPAFIHAVALIKGTAAEVNTELGLIAPEIGAGPFGEVLASAEAAERRCLAGYTP